MKRFNLFVIYLLLICVVRVNAQEDYSFVKSTYPFSIKGDQTLYLDLYSPAQQVMGERRPCVLFVFGGAFARGNRDMPKYMPYFDYLVQHGYTVVSIDYRLGLKEASQQKGLSEEQFVGHFINAVNIAVEDFFDATRFVIEHATEWNIDTNQIIANGSSAGAVTVLQGEYAISNNLHNVAEKLPNGFNYAGIISFAGAIFVPNGSLQWTKNPCPIMLLHGDADLQVPYDKLIVENMGFYGAKSIAESMDTNKFPYYFYKFEDYGHEIASDPMQNNKEDVVWFMHTLVRDKKLYQINQDQKEIGRPEVEKSFGIQDYIKGNFDR